MPTTRARRRQKLAPEFHVQYDPAEIPKPAAEYKATPYKNGTAADEDRKMEEAGQRIAQGDLSRRNLEIICAWKSTRRIGLMSAAARARISKAMKARWASGKMKGNRKKAA